MSYSNARFQGSIPELYDRHLGPVIFEPYAVDLARRVAQHATGPVLETACGTGILTGHLRDRLSSSVSLTATDLNQPMLDYARSKLHHLGPIEWLPADAQALPFPPESFACVACQFGLMFVPDRAAAFREARRVLVDGGLFAFNLWDGFDHNPFGRIAHETIGGLFRDDPPDFYRVPFGFHEPDPVYRLLVEAGFGDVRIEHVTRETHSESAEWFAVGLVKGNAVCLAIQERGAALDPVVEAVTTALRRAGGDRPFRSTMRALVVTARASR